MGGWFVVCIHATLITCQGFFIKYFPRNPAQNLPFVKRAILFPAENIWQSAFLAHTPDILVFVWSV
jgi:hypothetical protein